MRGIVWLVLLFAVAVVAALTLGRNDGLVSVFWAGWRVDLSLNLFLLLVLGGAGLVFVLLQSLGALLAMPERARAWRLSQRDRGAQQFLREALVSLWSARYGRAQKTVLKLLALNAKTPELRSDGGALALAHLLAAESAHRLQDRTRRQAQWELALELCRTHSEARAHEEAARLMAVAWALEDRDAEAALQHLAALPPGAARRTQALRLRLQAARMAKRPLEAMRTARLLAKHQGFAPGVAQSLLRSLAIDLLGEARDPDQLRAAWQQLEAADRRDAYVVARAAQQMALWGAAQEARAWIRPLWEQMKDFSGEERAELGRALGAAMAGIGPDWLPRLEAARTQFGREPTLAWVLGLALAEMQLWGKANQVLRSAAADDQLPTAQRRQAWVRLAELAALGEDSEQRLECLEQAARLN
ncbi:HemY protein [Inhella inkyongensis]|uniref:HemY protein n=1 Tax=Inhella inkyongensis TaxID=392593 RepID=A0A840SB60_9BURK|nr:heme biosynthesis HemY N-terminal domain-containing protein [Inhella inkyongensis]MBB5206024.1 HemY protein [Inhella inkyongensis]